MATTPFQLLSSADVKDQRSSLTDHRPASHDAPSHHPEDTSNSENHAQEPSTGAGGKTCGSPHPEQNDCFFVKEIQQGLQVDAPAMAEPNDTWISEAIEIPQNPGDGFVGAYQAAHDPQLMQHTLGRSVPSPQLIPTVVDQMIENAQLNSQTAHAVAALHKERTDINDGPCNRGEDSRGDTLLLPTESDVMNTIVEAATVVEGFSAK
eukprot:jgi/Botrbrau1/6925/Bobra.0215s0005.1